MNKFHDQHRQHYVVGHGEERARYPFRVATLEILLPQLRALEDFLLLLSVPALIVITLLWALGSAIRMDLPFISFVVDLLVTLFNLVAASILLLKWMDALQLWGQKCLQAYQRSQTIDQEVVLGSLGAGLLCLVLIGLILGTAATGGGDPRIVLQILVFGLLSWHYRILLKRDAPAPTGRGRN